MMTMWNARGGSSMLLSSILPAVVDYGHAHSKVGQGCMRPVSRGRLTGPTQPHRCS